MKILVIDNEEFFAENLCRYLKRYGENQAQYVTTTEMAMQIISQDQFDLILSDLQLPDSASENWVLQIGENNPGQKIVIMSSYPIPEKVAMSDKLNIIRYFEKPFDLQQIIKVINQTNLQNTNRR